MIKRAQVAGKVKIKANSVERLITLLLSSNALCEVVLDKFGSRTTPIAIATTPSGNWKTLSA